MVRKISRRERMFLMAGAAAVLVYLLGRWVFVPFLHFARGASGEISEQTDIMKAYQSVVAREPLLRDEDLALDEALERYGTYMLPSTTPPLAAADLESRMQNFAGQAGLTIQSKKLLAHRAQDLFLEVPMQLVANGTIENLGQFIVLLEGSEVFIGIRELHLRALPTRQPRRGSAVPPSAGQIQATMTISGLIPATQEEEEVPL